mmetsp:Transcript_1209/g.745  ORF Transcript_1209/g.745 Transcript_1209/m.745 type:complete len:95 (+) Transcript_1209:220-504(+)
MKAQQLLWAQHQRLTDLNNFEAMTPGDHSPVRTGNHSPIRNALENQPLVMANESPFFQPKSITPSQNPSQSVSPRKVSIEEHHQQDSLNNSYSR